MGNGGNAQGSQGAQLQCQTGHGNVRILGPQVTPAPSSIPIESITDDSLWNNPPFEDW